MSVFVKSESEKQAIYEIYRACRLCGGAGYKMPIIQKIVGTDELNLQHKIYECLRIEIHEEDRMPPLICELCADKVYDYYEFLELCRQTNKRTRLRLGLHYHKLTNDVATSTDVNIFESKPVVVKKECKPKISITHKTLLRTKCGKFKKIKKDKKRELRLLLGPQMLRKAKTLIDEDAECTKKYLRTRRPTPPPAPARSALKRNSKEDSAPLSILTKRVKEKDKQKEQDVPVKTVRIVEVKPSKPTAKEKSQLEGHKCNVCKQSFRTGIGLRQHKRAKHNIVDPPQIGGKNVESKPNLDKHIMDKHKVGKLNVDKLKVKKPNVDKHKVERPNVHRHKVEKPKVEKSKVVKVKLEVEVKCDDCSRTFSCRRLLKEHTCGGVADGQMSLECCKCRKQFIALKGLRSHEYFCKKDTTKIHPAVRKRVKPVQIRMAKCDPLLSQDGFCEITKIKQPYGLDKSCVYPYSKRRNNPILAVDKMVDIKAEIDSDIENNMNWCFDTEKVETLSKLSLQVILSNKFLSIHQSECGSDARLDINDLIENLGSERSCSSSPDIFAGFKMSNSLDRDFNRLFADSGSANKTDNIDDTNYTLSDIDTECGKNTSDTQSLATDTPCVDVTKDKNVSETNINEGKDISEPLNKSSSNDDDNKTCNGLMTAGNSDRIDVNNEKSEETVLNAKDDVTNEMVREIDLLNRLNGSDQPSVRNDITGKITDVELKEESKLGEDIKMDNVVVTVKPNSHLQENSIDNRQSESDLSGVNSFKTDERNFKCIDNSLSVDINKHSKDVVDEEKYNNRLIDAINVKIVDTKGMEIVQDVLEKNNKMIKDGSHKCENDKLNRNDSDNLHSANVLEELCEEIKSKDNILQMNEVNSEISETPVRSKDTEHSIINEHNAIDRSEEIRLDLQDETRENNMADKNSRTIYHTVDLRNTNVLVELCENAIKDCENLLKSTDKRQSNENESESTAAWREENIKSKEISNVNVNIIQNGGDGYVNIAKEIKQNQNNTELRKESQNDSNFVCDKLKMDEESKNNSICDDKDKISLDDLLSNQDSLALDNISDGEFNIDD